MANKSASIFPPPLAGEASKGLAGADFEADKRSFAVRMATARIGLVLLDREPAGGAGGEHHLRRWPGLHLDFDVIAVQMQQHRPVAGPTQLNHVPLAHA